MGERGPGERLGQFSGQVETSQSKAELTNLCFGQSDWPDIYNYRDDYAKACDVVLRHQRICEVVLRGESPKKDCE